MNLESHELFTSYPGTASTKTAVAAASDDSDSQTSTIHGQYQVRTLSMHNIIRLSILPIYPPFSISPTTIKSPRTPSLLLVNVTHAILNAECFFQNLL